MKALTDKQATRTARKYLALIEKGRAAYDKAELHLQRLVAGVELGRHIDVDGVPMQVIDALEGGRRSAAFHASMFRRFGLKPVPKKDLPGEKVKGLVIKRASKPGEQVVITEPA